jgi:hypothetical protein
MTTLTVNPGQAVNLAYIGNPTAAQLAAYLALGTYSAAQSQALIPYAENVTGVTSNVADYVGTNDGLMVVNAKQAADSNNGTGWGGFTSYSAMPASSQVQQRYYLFANANIVYAGAAPSRAGAALDPTQMLSLSAAQITAGYQIYWDLMTDAPVAMTVGQYQQYLDQASLTWQAGLVADVSFGSGAYVSGAVVSPAYWAVPGNIKTLMTTIQNEQGSQQTATTILENSLAATGFSQSQIQAIVQNYQPPQSLSGFSNVPTTDVRGDPLQMGSAIWVMQFMGYSNQQIANYLGQNGCSASTIEANLGATPQ